MLWKGHRGKDRSRHQKAKLLQGGGRDFGWKKERNSCGFNLRRSNVSLREKLRVSAPLVRKQEVMKGIKNQKKISKKCSIDVGKIVLKGFIIC